MATHTELNAAARRLIDLVGSSPPSSLSPSAAIDAAGLEPRDDFSPQGLVRELVRHRYLVEPVRAELRVGPRGWMWLRSDAWFCSAARERADMMLEHAAALADRLASISDAEVEQDLPMQRFSEEAATSIELAAEVWALLLEMASPHLVFSPREGAIRVGHAALDRGSLRRQIQREGSPPWHEHDDGQSDERSETATRSTTPMRDTDDFRPFHELPVENVLKQAAASFTAAIEALADSIITSDDEEELSGRLASEHELTVPHLAFDELTVEPTTRMVPAEQFPISYAMQPGKSYERDAYIFAIPYRGDPIFLRCYDSTRSWGGDHTFRLERGTGRLLFEVFEFKLTADVVTQRRDAELDYLRKYMPAVVSAVESYNESLRRRALQLIGQRREKLVAKAELLAHLGTPVAARSAPPATVAIAAPVKRRTISSATVESVVGRVPDPTLHEAQYKEILGVLFTQARAMETTPTAFAGLDEEAIRDHLLGGLALGFQGTVTGETFNKRGKTDILLRHENKNVFVAECKIWKGKVAYFAAITQMLGYLTWRDSKAALLLFVRNRDLLLVHKTIASATPSHPDFDGVIDPEANGIVRYRFRLPDTDGVMVHVGVLLFHLPKP